VRLAERLSVALGGSKKPSDLLLGACRYTPARHRPALGASRPSLGCALGGQDAHNNRPRFFFFFFYLRAGSRSRRSRPAWTRTRLSSSSSAPPGSGKPPAATAGSGASLTRGRACRPSSNSASPRRCCSRGPSWSWRRRPRRDFHCSRTTRPTGGRGQ
jgi:hypothetical protein